MAGLWGVLAVNDLTARQEGTQVATKPVDKGQDVGKALGMISIVAGVLLLTLADIIPGATFISTLGNLIVDLWSTAL